MVAKKNVALVTCGIAGVVFLVLGCILISVFADLIHSEVDSEIPLKPGSDSYTNWQKPSSPILFQVWMFDVVNAEEIIDGEKPAVVQMGPYTYRELRVKVGANFSDNGTVQYREDRSFVFDEELSSGKENDTFHCVNLPLLTVMDLLRYEPKSWKEGLDLILKAIGETLFIKLTVKELMWGYQVDFIKDADRILKLLNRTIPDMFGLFYNQNGTDDGLYSIFSGQKGLSNFGEIITWNGAKQLDVWTSDIANAINGSDGTIYPPFIDTSTTKYLFSSDLCRSLGMDYVSGVTNRGIDMKRFVAPDILFGNVTVNPYNSGFCTPPGNCLPSGLLNVSACRAGAPIVMSMPHFLGCDPYIVDSVVGMKPNRKEHQSFIDIEPMTGVVMNAGKRLQINAFMNKVDGFSDTKKFSSMYMPVMWLSESGLISEKDASKFRSEVLDKLKLLDIIKYGLIALGGFMTAVVVAVFITSKFVVKTEPESVSKSDPTDDEIEPILRGNGGIQTSTRYGPI